MLTPEFWALIQDSSGGDDDEHAQRLTERLATLPAAQITAFADHLATALHALDTPAHFAAVRTAGDDAFLYARCAVVLRGRENYESVLRTPAEFAAYADEDAELLLGAAPEAYERATGKPWQHRTPVSYELQENRAAWGLPGDSAAGTQELSGDESERPWFLLNFGYETGSRPPHAYTQARDAFVDLLNSSPSWQNWWREFSDIPFCATLRYSPDEDETVAIEIRSEELAAELQWNGNDLQRLDDDGQYHRACRDLEKMITHVQLHLELPPPPEFPVL